MRFIKRRMLVEIPVFYIINSALEWNSHDN